MYKPSTTFVWNDDSGQTTSTPILEVRPLFLTASSFDKGPEKMQRVYADDFYKLYGTDISFVRHGQPAIQAANIIDNGGELLIKRVVASDATLANIIITATVTQARTAKVNTISGKPIYIDADTGKETESVTSASGAANERAYINAAVVKYNVVNVSDAKTINDVSAQAKTLFVNKEAGEVEGAGDPATWINYDGILEDGADAPAKTNGSGSLDNDDFKVGEAKVGEAKILGEDDLTEYYEIGTILQDNNLNVFKVIANNKLQYLGNAASEYTYPLFVVTDNGRGQSMKRVNITCDYEVSKNAGFALYRLNYLGTPDYDAEYVRFTADSDVIYLNKSMSLTMASKSLLQVKAESIADGATQFIEKISEFTGLTKESLEALDVFFGCDLRGNKIPQIIIDKEGYSLDSAYAMALQGGSNGLFGDKPFGTAEYSKQLVEFFNGTFDDTIFDQDTYKIEACVDANYPLEVKDAIADLVTFREDFYFFRDYGLNNNSYDAITLVSESMETKNKFIADYYTTYDIQDKFTKKQINVAITYSLGRILVNHLNNYRNCPIMGILYNCTIPEAIEGTINYLPKFTPMVDQKTLLVDQHINYASVINGVLTIETQMTSQVKETQCSHINNILLVQETMRKVRTLVPRLRGSFIDRGDGLDKYAQQVDAVIKQDAEKYESIEFTWTADDVQIANKLFNAALRVAFKSFAIAELFNIYTID